MSAVIILSIRWLVIIFTNSPAGDIPQIAFFDVCPESFDVRVAAINAIARIDITTAVTG